MNELKDLCKERGLSFIMLLDNHKRFGLSVREYFDQFKPNEFQDEAGRAEIDVYADGDSWVQIEVFNKSQTPLFICYEANMADCARGAIQGIYDGIDFRKSE